MPYISATIIYNGSNVQTGFFTGVAPDVRGYDYCISSPYQFTLTAKSGGRQIACWYDTASKTLNKYATSESSVYCNYICLKGAGVISSSVDVGLVDPIYGVTTKTKDVGANKNCTAFVKGFGRNQRSATYYCTYDKNTGLLTERCSGACSFLQCGYVCLEDGGEGASSVAMEQFVVGQAGIKDIGANRDCVPLLRGDKTYLYGFSINCNYNLLTGDFTKGGGIASTAWWNCNYFCVDDSCVSGTPVCGVNECGIKNGNCESCGGNIANGFCDENVYKCNDGFGNCNYDWSDGCEVNITSDLINCGGCVNGPPSVNPLMHLGDGQFGNLGGLAGGEDLAGGDNIPVLYGAVSQVSEGKFGGGMKFNGGDSYIRVLNDPKMNTQNITVAFWAYPTVDGDSRDVVGKYYGLSDPYGSWGVEFRSDKQWGFGFDDNGRTEPVTSSYSLNQWYFIVMTINRTEMVGYVNGVKVVNHMISQNMRYNSGDLFIGKWGSPTADSRQFFIGTVDELRVFNRSISASEVVSLQGNTIADTSGLVLYYDFDNYTNPDVTPVSDGIDGNVMGVSCGASSVCVNGTCEGFSNYWTDMNGKKFGVGESVDLNDYVRLFSNIGPDYEITKGGVFNNTISVGYWKAGSKGDDYEFRSSEGGDVSENSIEVKENERDSPLSVSVLSPYCGQNFTLGDIGRIEVGVNDSDDLVVGNVSVDGVGIMDFNTSVNNTFIFDYGFEEVGSIGIVVWANNTRGKKFSTRLNVMVVNISKTDYYVAACIDSPENFDRFDSSTVFFNASSSRGLKYDFSSDSYTIIPKERLNFSWTFLLSDGTFGVPCFGVGGTATCGSGKVYAFNRTFPTVNDNKAFLTVSTPASEMV